MKRQCLYCPFSHNSASVRMFLSSDGLVRVKLALESSMITGGKQSHNIRGQRFAPRFVVVLLLIFLLIQPALLKCFLQIDSSSNI